MKKSCGCWRSCRWTPRYASPVCSNCGNPSPGTVSGSRENIARSCASPPHSSCCAMPMSQLVDINRWSPRLPRLPSWSSNPAESAPWIMNAHPPALRCAPRMGVASGCQLVPDGLRIIGSVSSSAAFSGALSMWWPACPECSSPCIPPALVVCGCARAEAAAQSSAGKTRRGGIPHLYRGGAPRATSRRCTGSRSRSRSCCLSRRAPTPRSRRE